MSTLDLPLQGTDELTKLIEAEPLLPREMFWIYPLAPIPFVALMVDLTRLNGEQLARALGAMYVPFVALTVFFVVTYTWLMPRWLRAVKRPAAKVALHTVVIVGASIVISQLVLPLHGLISGYAVGAVSYAVTSIFISAIMMVPALIIQRLRVRARAVETLALAQRQAALRAQLEALQARTNPHFFFNSINTVASLIADQPELAERTLERLAELFRYALDAGKRKSVPLSREFEMAQDYLAIQRARFGEQLETSVTLDPQVAQVEVPPLILQPLVENAILHGLHDRKHGRVEVRARRHGDLVRIEVLDDGPGPGASGHQGTQTSVRELQERLRLFFGRASEVEVSGAPGGGCLVSVAVPAP
ncbi:MAG: sensor histidine kinase [Myxococcaceae bacterium]